MPPGRLPTLQSPPPDTKASPPHAWAAAETAVGQASSAQSFRISLFFWISRLCSVLNPRPGRLLQSEREGTEMRKIRSQSVSSMASWYRIVKLPLRMLDPGRADLAHVGLAAAEERVMKRTFGNRSAGEFNETAGGLRGPASAPWNAIAPPET